MGKGEKYHVSICHSPNWILVTFFTWARVRVRVGVRAGVRVRVRVRGWGWG